MNKFTPATSQWITAWAIFLITLATGCFIAVETFFLIPYLSTDSDLQVYEAIGQNLRRSEYAPLMTWMYTIMASNSGHFPFLGVWIIFFTVTLAAIAIYAQFSLAGARYWHFPLVIYGCLLLFGPLLTIARHDFLVLGTFYLAWLEFTRRRYRRSAVFLTLAAFIKIVPVIVWPVLFLHTPPKHRRGVLMAFLATAAALSAIILAGLGTRQTLSNLSSLKEFHGARAVQLESTWSAAHLLWQSLRGQDAYIAFHHGSWHNDSLWNYTKAIKIIASTILAAFLLRIYLRRQKTIAGDSHLFLRDLIAITLLALLLSPVLSPQFLVWALPLIPLWFLRPDKTLPKTPVRQMLLITALTAFATQMIYPIFYTRLLDQQLFAIILLAARQILLLALFFTFLRLPVTISPDHASPQKQENHRRPARLQRGQDYPSDRARYSPRVD